MRGEEERYTVGWDAYHRQIQAGPCFICQIVAGNPAYPADVVYEDDRAIAFLDKYPVFRGYTLVAPREHRVQVTGDFALDEYLALQQVVRRVAEAIRQEFAAERIYLLSLGSMQGNAHVHWHVAPLPPGVPYRQQQIHAINRPDVLKLSEAEKASIVARIRRRIAQGNGVL